MPDSCTIQVTRKEMNKFFPFLGTNDETAYIVARTIANMKNKGSEKTITSCTFDFDTSTYFFQVSREPIDAKQKDTQAQIR